MPRHANYMHSLRGNKPSLSLSNSCSGGAAGAVSRITGALGKGIATLTLDDDYQKKRRENMTKKPADLKEGLARGGKGLVMVRERGEAKVLLWYVREGRQILLWYVREGRQRSCYGT